MTFNIAILMQADGDGARAEVTAVGDAAKKTTGAVKGMGTASQKASGQTKGLAGSADQTEAQLKGLTAAAQQNAAAAKAMGQANRVAAGQTANLVAQGNDVMVMMMAGQNPLQLAMQQGTQISQVIGPMGATGAFKALGSAVMGMLNPISLVTIGAIAAGAAMVNWLRDSREGGEDFVDVLEDVKSALSEYNTLAANQKVGVSDQFDAAKQSIERTSQAYLDLINIAKADAFRNISDLSQSLVTSATHASFFKREMKEVANVLGADIQLHGNITDWKERREQVKLFKDALDNLSGAGSLDDQYSAALRLRDMFTSTVDVSGELSSQQDEFWRSLAQSIYQMELLGAATDTIKSGYAQYYQSRIAAEQNIANLRATELEQQTSIYSLYAQTRAENDAAVVAAQAELTTLQDQASLQAIIAQFGADSHEATVLRTMQERLAYAQTVNTRDVSQSVKDALMGAWDAANGLSGVDTSSQLELAANQASRIANELARAVDNAISLANQGVGAADRARINFDFKDDPIGKAAALARAEFDSKTQLPEGADSTLVNVVEKERREFVAARVEAAGYTEKLREWQAAQNAANRKSAGGAGAATNATKQQRKAVTDLITGLQDEIAILNASDPVQKEMLRNREAMAGATDAERQTIGDLIAQRNQDSETLTRQQETWTELRSTAYGFVQDMRSSGGDLEQVFAKLADRIADMVFQAALLGEGPLAGMFGLGGGGGALGTILGAAFPKLAPIPAKADGGMLYGEGGPRDDKILMYGSNGEFMMNAKATAKHRHLLEALNAGGSLPGFANGGAIGGDVASIAPQINIMPMNNSSVPLHMDVQEETGPRGQKRQKLVISDAVAMGLSGGAAKKVMRDQFGARQRGIGRG